MATDTVSKGSKLFEILGDNFFYKQNLFCSLLQTSSNIDFDRRLVHMTSNDLFNPGILGWGSCVPRENSALLMTVLPSHKLKIKRGQKYKLASVVPDPCPGFSIKENHMWKLHPNDPSLSISNPLPVAGKHQSLFFSAFETSAKPGDYKLSWEFPPKSTLSLGTTGESTHLV